MIRKGENRFSEKIMLKQERSRRFGAWDPDFGECFKAAQRQNGADLRGGADFGQALLPGKPTPDVGGGVVAGGPPAETLADAPGPRHERRGIARPARAR